MGRISRRAADNINEMWQAHKARRPGGTGFGPVGPQFLLAKTTATHAQGDSQAVDIYSGPKGSEVHTGQTFKAYNRIDDLDAGEWVYIKWIGDGWEILNSRSTGASGCGACTEGTGEMTVDLGDGFMAAETYQATLFCESIGPITFTGFSGGAWTGSATSMTIDCNGSPVTWTASLTYFSHLPGNGTSEGIVVTWSDGTNEWKWINDAAFQPHLLTELSLFSGLPECPCGDFDDYPCLRPIPTPPEEP